MSNDKKIRKITDYSVQELKTDSELLKRGLNELGLTSQVLKLISNGDVKLEELDGSRVFSFSDGETFRIVFFDELNSSEFSQKSDSMELLVYQQIKDANIYQMFKSLGRDFSELCLTHNQILEFLEQYKNYSGKTNHFLFKSSDEIFIAQICSDPDGSMRLFGGEISDDDINGYIYPVDQVDFRVIVPK